MAARKGFGRAKATPRVCGRAFATAGGWFWGVFPILGTLVQRVPRRTFVMGRWPIGQGGISFAPGTMPRLSSSSRYSRRKRS